MFFKRKEKDTTKFGSIAVGAVFCWPGTDNPMMKTIPWVTSDGSVCNAVHLTGTFFTSVAEDAEVAVISGSFIED